MSDRIAVFNDGVGAAMRALRPSSTSAGERFRRRVHRQRTTSSRELSTGSRADAPSRRSRARARLSPRPPRGACEGRPLQSSRSGPRSSSSTPTNHPYDNEIAVKFVARIYVGDFIRVLLQVGGRVGKSWSRSLKRPLRAEVRRGRHGPPAMAHIGLHSRFPPHRGNAGCHGG